MRLHPLGSFHNSVLLNFAALISFKSLDISSNCNCVFTGTWKSSFGYWEKYVKDYAIKATSSSTIDTFITTTKYWGTRTEVAPLDGDGEIL